MLEEESSFRDFVLAVILVYSWQLWVLEDMLESFDLERNALESKDAADFNEDETYKETLSQVWSRADKPRIIFPFDFNLIYCCL